jgi:hypothetical protein
VTKNLDENFTDWHGEAFGYGYGTGEVHTIKAVMSFLACIPSEGAYNYKNLEKELHPAAAWLLIGIFCECDMIEYGSSPRFGWLTKSGVALKDYIAGSDFDSLYRLSNISIGKGYYPCGPDHCSCVGGDVCENPFWSERIRTALKGE